MSLSLPRIIGLVALLASASPAWAQLNSGNQWPAPKLNFVFPPGGKAGTSVEVSFGGADVDQPESLWFSHPGLKSELIVPPTPTPDPKKPDMKKDPVAPSKFKVDVGGEVPPGLYDVRLVTARGISNPRVFVVGTLKEDVEKEPNNDVDQAQKIEFGTTINGVIAAPTDVDYYSINAKKGQRILFHVAAASIDSRLNSEIRVFDSANRPIGYARNLPGEDALLDFTAPSDGDFIVRINQFTYTAGTPDYFYRLTVSGGPWIDAVFPPVVEPGKSSPVTVFGRNLPGGQVDPKANQGGKTLEKLATTVNAPADPNSLSFQSNVPPTQGTLNGFDFRLGDSNPKFIAFATAPVVIENDENDTSDKAQVIKVPCEIAGRIDKKRDRDWFAFEAKKGDMFMIEAFSQRLGAPTDLYFKVINAAKKQEIVLQDDNAEVMHPRGYYTPSRDPQPFKFVAPEDGTYQLLVGSHVGDILAGPGHVYRVRVAPEQPDFRLIVMPAEDYRADACNIGRGGATFFNVLVQRLDGFKGEVALTIEGLPKGVTCPPQTMGANAKQAMLTILAGDDAPEKFEGTLKVLGTAIVNGQKVVREARPASVTWGFANPQNNNPAITRHDRSLVLAIRGKAPVFVSATSDKLVIPVGDKADITYKLSRIDPEFKGNFQAQAGTGDLPANVTAGTITFAPGKDEQKVTITTTATALPGTYNLVLRAFGPVAPPKGKNVPLIVPTSPVTLIVVPKQVANLSLEKNDLPVKAGEEVVLGLKLARQFDYAGEFKVQLLPEGAKDVSASEFTVGPGQSEAKFAIKAAPEANPGPRQNLTLRAVAVVHGVTLNHDLKFNVNVVAEKKEKDKK